MSAPGFGVLLIGAASRVDNQPSEQWLSARLANSSLLSRVTLHVGIPRANATRLIATTPGLLLVFPSVVENAPYGEPRPRICGAIALSVYTFHGCG
jgi:hypothetical protein